jgi:CheY-like chemotaxis protein
MSKKILIVEDSFAVSIVMERMVEKLGYTFKTVYKGKDAINAAKNIAPDLVIMDIMLPGSMDGIDAARELAKNNIPFIYNSEYTEDSIIKRAKATDPLGYLVKPLNFENFKIAIEMAFEKIEIKKKLDQETHERERAMLELKELNEELRHLVSPRAGKNILWFFQTFFAH